MTDVKLMDALQEDRDHNERMVDLFGIHLKSQSIQHEKDLLLFEIAKKLRIDQDYRFTNFINSMEND